MSDNNIENRGFGDRIRAYCKKNAYVIAAVGVGIAAIALIPPFFSAPAPSYHFYGNVRNLRVELKALEEQGVIVDPGQIGKPVLNKNGVIVDDKDPNPDHSKAPPQQENKHWVAVFSTHLQPSELDRFAEKITDQLPSLFDQQTLGVSIVSVRGVKFYSLYLYFETRQEAEDWCTDYGKHHLPCHLRKRIGAPSEKVPERSLGGKYDISSNLFSEWVVQVSSVRSPEQGRKTFKRSQETFRRPKGQGIRASVRGREGWNILSRQSENIFKE